jgi:hypothetical protein
MLRKILGPGLSMILLAYSRIGLASFIGYAFSNNIGMSMILWVLVTLIF